MNGHVSRVRKPPIIIILCEHWLIESEIVTICDEVFKPYCVHMKSSMTSEDLTMAGRPYGGVGFVCKQKAGFTYDEIKCDSDRVMGLDISYNGCKVITVCGVYMPYNNGTATQTQLYIDTLNQLSAIIEVSSGQAPYMVLGDMNTELSNKATLNKNCYKKKPFNCHSVLLYDFLCDNELVICNTKRSSDNFTYHKGRHTSYIDFVFMNSYAHENIMNCDVLQHDHGNNNDHLGVLCELCVECPDAPVDGLKDARKNQRRPKWEDAEFRTTYLQSLRSALASIPAVDPSCVKAENAQAVINNHCKQLKDALHQAASAGLARITTDRRRRVHWWSHDCNLHRDRTRLYFHIWKGMGRPTSGQAYECYKGARRNYKKVCRDTSNAAIRGGYANTSRLLKCNKFSDFWRVVNQAKSGRKHECKVAIDNLEGYFEDKFRACDGKTEKMTNCENSVYDKNSMMDNVDFSYVTMAEADVVKCIKLLTYGKAPGVDGLAAEHYIHGLGSSLPLHISSILTLCLRHGLVPDTFLHGVLIPLYKTGKAAQLASSYRPVTLSVTLSKVLELHILHMCQQHQPHPAQFGFATDRGTDMAIALAHDVSEHFNRRGSPVFICSLDAQGAFDHIPHSVIFSRRSAT